MTESGSRAALDRVVRRAGGASVFEALVSLPGSDLTTLQLELMRRRAAALSPASVLERYRRDRFTAPSPLPFAALRRVEDVLLDALAARPEPVEVLTPAPLAPLGTHSVLATVDQNKVVSTVRGTDVAADPTNGLALEAAVRRQDAQRAATVAGEAAGSDVTDGVGAGGLGSGGAGAGGVAAGGAEGVDRAGAGGVAAGGAEDVDRAGAGGVAAGGAEGVDRAGAGGVAAGGAGLAGAAGVGGADPAAAGGVVREGSGPLAGVVRLAAIQRVVRAQYVAGPAMFAHFSLFAQVTAGRDVGGLGFERAALAEQLAVVTGALPRLGAEEVEVRLTVLDPRFAPVADAIVAAAVGDVTAPGGAVAEDGFAATGGNPAGNPGGDRAGDLGGPAGDPGGVRAGDAGGSAGDPGGPAHDLPGDAGDAAGDGSGDLAGVPVRAVLNPDRPSGRGYYEGLCFKVMARLGGEWAEVGDGGFTGWTRDLLSNGKERLLISGLGIDRLAASATP
ncbi:hypothetical protein [Jiangella sp. DSM 45060]|uniref:hypothetical protein n=1 Tax=Jiangella sp. DSM 45060 TaxID=1798224 RepID=UPI00087B30E9|nr:hypothetical protein [Jiangella sp. DSM 45060]SDS69702.1 hypothetical protein SAMN04515669_1696 [Jiangella sp. DSM 45060]